MATRRKRTSKVTPTTSPSGNVTFKREVKDGKETDKLWLDRINKTIEWLSNEYWNGWPSWNSAYLLDRTVHYVNKTGDSEFGGNLDHRTETLDFTKITVPLLTNIIRNIVPFLINRDPHFFGHAANPNNNRAVQIRIAHLNAIWREQKMNWQIIRSAYDAAIIGHGICKAGFTRSLLEDQTENPEKAGKLTYQDYIKDESAWIRRINPFMFLYARDASDYDLESARWCAELIPDTVQNIVDNKAYKSSTRKALEKGRIMPVLAGKTAKDQGDDFKKTWGKFRRLTDNDDFEITEDTQVLKVEIWDKKFKQRRVYLLGESANPEDQLLALEAWPENLDNLPYRKLDYIYMPNQPYGMGQIRYGIDTQKLTNIHRSMMAEALIRMPVNLVHTGASELDPKEKDKLRNNRWYEVLHLNQGENLVPLPAPDVSGMWGNAFSIIQNDLGELSDQDVLARGGTLPSRTSAREISARENIRGAKLDQQIEATKEFTLEMAKLVLRYTASLKSDQLVPIIGKQGRVSVRLSDSPGEGEFEDSLEVLKAEISRLEMGVISKEVDPPSVKRKQLMEFFQLATNPNILQLFQSMQIPVNIRGLFRAILETFNIPEFEESFPILSEEPPTIPLDFVPINTGSQPGISDGQQTNQASAQGGNENTGTPGAGAGIPADLAQLFNQGSQ